MDIPEVIHKYTNFTVTLYLPGWMSKLLWFRAEHPVTWVEARERLIRAGVLHRDMAGMAGKPGGWMLSIAKDDFSEELAVPLPEIL